jgi:hypothetical protein
VKPTGGISVSATSLRMRPPGGSASFDITGTQPGGADVALEVPGTNTIRGVTVVVEECEYEITINAHWNFHVGFEPDVFSSVQHLRLPRNRPNVYIATGTVQNGAAGVTKGCTPNFQLPDSQVIVKAEIVQGQYRPEVKLNVSYANIPVAVTVTCPGVPGRGTSKDTAVIANIDTTMKAWEFMDTKTYPGHVGASHLAVATSDTVIVLTLVRP